MLVLAPDPRQDRRQALAMVGEHDEMRRFGISRLVGRGKRTRLFLELFWQQFNQVGCKEAAAALTYTTLFAIVPIMTVAFSILAALPALQDNSDTIQRWVFDYFAPSAGDQVIRYLEEFSRQAGNLTAIGLAFLVVTSVMMLRTTEKTLNRVWKVKAARKGSTSLMMYWALLTLGPVSLGVALGASSYLTSVSLVTDVVEYLGGLAFLLALLPFVVMTAIMSTAYIIIPNCHVPLREGIIGGAVAALFFELAKAGFSLFVRSSPSYEVIYGAFAAVPLFLLWIYISWLLFLAGSVLVYSLVVFEERQQTTPRLQSLLRLLSTLWARQQQGRSLRLDEVRQALLAAGASRWDEFRNVLMDLRLMQRTDENCFVLTRDLSSLTLAELVEMLPWPATEALRVGPADSAVPAGGEWEDELARRCQQAREGLEAPLNVSLEDLFNYRQERTHD